MVFAGERYYKIYPIVLTILGLWPHQKTVVLQIQKIFYFTIYFSLIFFQLTTFITTKCDIIFVIRELSCIFPTIVYVLNYNSFYFNVKEIKQSLEHIKLDWNIFADENEIKIIEEYAFEVYIFSLIMFILTALCMTAFMVIQFVPEIYYIIPFTSLISVDIYLEPNKKLPFEFFIDKEQYFVFYVLYEIVAMSIGIFTTVATGTFLTAIARHCCATYKIARNLIQNVASEDALRIPAPQRVYFMYQDIRRAVNIHRRSTQFMNASLNSFHIWYLPLIMVGVVSLSCILFRLLNTITQVRDFQELLTCSMLFSGHVVYMLIGNYLGQSITDHSADILNATYNTLWYAAPMPIQKLLLFMQTSTKNYKLVVGGVFVASLEGFTTLITSAISYFTVMYAMR